MTRALLQIDRIAAQARDAAAGGMADTLSAAALCVIVICLFGIA